MLDQFDFCSPWFPTWNMQRSGNCFAFVDRKMTARIVGIMNWLAPEKSNQRQNNLKKNKQQH